MSVAAFMSAAIVAAIAPSGPWNVEGDENICLLSRQYGTETDRIIVGFQPIYYSERMDIVVISQVSGLNDWQGIATIRIGTSQKKFSGEYFSVKSDDGTKKITRMTLDAKLFGLLKSDDVINIRAGELKASIVIPGFSKAKSAFDNCARERLDYWGVNLDSLSDERSPIPAQGEIDKAFNNTAYPNKALAIRSYGTTVAMLKIDKAGQVEKCKIVVGAGDILNDRSCERLNRIRFKPGHDATGIAVPSLYIMRVRWQL